MEDAGQCFPAVQVYCQDLCLVLRAVYQTSWQMLLQYLCTCRS